jgi:hypothetical protein
MILFALFAMQAVAGPQVQDSVYSTEALRQAVQAAADVNRDAPRSLLAYRARLESEISLIVVDTLGRERTGQIEQLAGTAAWGRDSGYDAHVIGYRTQSAGGFPLALAGMMRSWTVPMLYGERLSLGLELDMGNRLDSLVPVPVVGVHPFAADRDEFYQFSGGDTVAVLTTPERRIRLMRIRVTPNLRAQSRFAAFDGEIDIDAERHDIVRMRGRLMVNRLPVPRLERLALTASGTEAIAFIEFVNAEYDGNLWLPATQRIELQVRSRLFGGQGTVMRVMSHFSDVVVDEAAPTDSSPSSPASLRARATFAPSDSMASYDAWKTQLGTATASMGADDFSDIAPLEWKGGGPPLVTAFPSRPDRIVHYDRIEGLFTGAELSLEMRDASPGLLARMYGGWAWSERTARGGVTVIDAKGSSRTELQLDRSLATTGSFENDRLDGSSSLGALLVSVEDEDYVDRWNASLSQTEILGGITRAFITERVGVDRDVDIAESLTHGPILRSVLFRPNRHSATGDYGIGAVDVELHPNVTGEFLDPGIGSTLHVEAAAGQLSWVRSIATISARDYAGPVTLSARVRAGAVFANVVPPQTLFEVGNGGGFGEGDGSGGGSGELGRYPPRFAGDRAVSFRSYGLYGFPIFRAPHRVRWLLIPGLSPGLTAGVDAGWTAITTDAARRAVLARDDSTTSPYALQPGTGHVRATASVGLTFFAHSLSVGIARPLDQPGRWRWVFGLGQRL